MVCSTVTTFLTNHFNPLRPPDPSQINMTQHKYVWHLHSVRPDIYCANTTAIPEENNTHTLNGSYSATWTPCAPPLPIASAEEKALIFCSAEGREKWASHFSISTCQVVQQPQSVGQSICQSQYIVSWEGEKRNACVCPRQTLTKELFCFRSREKDHLSATTLKPTNGFQCCGWSVYAIDCLYPMMRERWRAVVFFMCMHKWMKVTSVLIPGEAEENIFFEHGVFSFQLHFYGRRTATVTLKALM